jgi:hypothetical protein
MSLKITALEMLVMPFSDGSISSLQEEGKSELERLQKIEAAASNLFQACADLPLPEMNRMEAVINAMSEALK